MQYINTHEVTINKCDQKIKKSLPNCVLDIMCNSFECTRKEKSEGTINIYCHGCLKTFMALCVPSRTPGRSLYLAIHSKRSTFILHLTWNYVSICAKYFFNLRSTIKGI